MNPTVGRFLFILLAILAGCAMFLWLADAITKGQRFNSVILVLVASPGLMFLALAVQRFHISSTDIRNMSAAAIIGDLFALTAAMFILAHAWKLHADHLWSGWRSPIWMVLSFVIGLAFGMAMHMMGGKSNSNSAIISEQLHDSATSWGHNLGVVPGIVAALCFGLVPLLCQRATLGWAVCVIVALAFWFVLVYVDGIRAQLPDDHPWHFNSQALDWFMDWSKWRPRVFTA